ncbi:hypothetical protein [Streptomyces sp. NPDC002602]|uniref:hypothetical protein n=1 Tax=Streptomyces sp. NPDC002602 TaxID=3364654 RepID=UPI0036CC4107
MADRMPPVSLFLTEIEYRRATARDLGGLIGAEARRWAADQEADSLEVVVQGRLVNNLPHEMLVTCRDHSNSGRSVWYAYRNQSAFIVNDTEVELGQLVLSAEQETTFTWIDRRPKSDWISIYKLHTLNRLNDPELGIPRLSLLDTVQTLFRRAPRDWVRRNKIKRSGFQIICEPRTAQRIATVWEAEVIKAPVEIAGRDEIDRLIFDDWIGMISGPLDDRVLHYRVRFDPTLALINMPKHRRLAGRF